MTIVLFILFIVLKIIDNSFYYDIFIGLILLLWTISIIITIIEKHFTNIEIVDDTNKYIEGDKLRIRLKSNIKSLNPKISIKLEKKVAQYDKPVPYTISRSFADDKNEINISTLEPGTYEFIIKKVIFNGIFGVFHIAKKSNSKTSFIVYPKAEHCDYKRLKQYKQTGEGLATMFKGDDYTELYEVREYVEGDDLKHLHHSLTAKYQKQMIKVGSKSERTIYLYEIDDGISFEKIIPDLRKIKYLSECDEMKNKNSFCYIKYRNNWKVLISQAQYYKFVNEVYNDYAK